MCAKTNRQAVRRNSRFSRLPLEKRFKITLAIRPTLQDSDPQSHDCKT
jgi:hypothetical protein